MGDYVGWESDSLDEWCIELKLEMGSEEEE